MTVDLLALPFDQYQRYTVAKEIADLVRTHLAQPYLQVLDVGGFYRTRRGDSILPLAQFLPQDQVVAVDLVAEALPGYLLSSGRSLPFHDGAFEVVVSCDTLEHVPATGRPEFLDQLLRVARHFAVIIAPFDSEFTRVAERLLYDYLTFQGLQQAQLREHMDLGLPDAEVLRTSLAERNLGSVDFADGYIHRWLVMMLIKHTPGLSMAFHLDLDRYYNRHLSVDDRREPAYRRVFVAAKPGNEALLPTITSRFQVADAPPADSGFDLAADLISVLNRGPSDTLVQALRQAEGQLAALESENERLRQTVEGYERGRFIRFMRQVHKWREKLGAE